MKIFRKLFLLCGLFLPIYNSAFAKPAETKTVTAVSQTDIRMCVITKSGSILCWNTVSGSLDGEFETFWLDQKPATQITQGLYHKCAINNAGDLFCWGSPEGVGLNLDRSSPTPSKVVLPKGETVAKVSAGYDLTFAITKSGKLYHWGYDTTKADKTIIKTPQLFLGTGLINNKKVKNISSTSDYPRHTCAITEDNDLYCWGANSYGQLGTGDTEEYFSPTYVLPSIVDVSVASYHSCAINTNKELLCWGDNSDGEIDINNFDYKIMSPTLASNEDVISVSTDEDHICYINTSKDLFCSGSASSIVPHNSRQISGYKLASNVKSVSAGDDNTCFIDSKDKLLCSGRPQYDFGNIEGSVSDTCAPKKFSDSGLFHNGHVRLFNITNHYLWSLSTDNKFSGRSTRGYYNDRDVFFDKAWISGISKFEEFNFELSSFNDASGYALKDGRLYNINYETAELSLFEGYTNDDVIDMSLGDGHACLINSSGKLYCWGDNDKSQLGTLPENYDLTPYPFAGTGLLDGSQVKAISAFEDRTCAVNSNNDAFCWGDENPDPTKFTLDNVKVASIKTINDGFYILSNEGEIYYKDTKDDTLTKIGLLDGKPAIKLTANVLHACAINTAGRLFCWGNNTDASLGVGNTKSYKTPQKVFNTLSAYNDGLIEDSTVVDVKAGFESTCALTKKGSFYCWGWEWGSRLTDSHVTPTVSNLCDSPCCKDKLYSEIGKSCQRPDAGITGKYFCSSKSRVGAVGCASKSTAEICDNGKDDDGDGLVDEKDPDCKNNDPVNPDEPDNPSNISFSNPTPATVVVKKKNAVITLGPKATLEDWLKEVDTSKLKPAKKKKLKFVYQVKLVYLGKPKKTTIFTVKKNKVTRRALKAGKYKVSYQVIIKLGKKNFKKSKYSKATAFTIGGKKK